MLQALPWHSLERSSRMPKKVTHNPDQKNIWTFIRLRKLKPRSSSWSSRMKTSKRKALKIQMSPEMLQISSNEDCSWR
ncbi:unnamed protein product [Caenorhabditis brenneri]